MRLLSTLRHLSSSLRKPSSLQKSSSRHPWKQLSPSQARALRKLSLWISLAFSVAQLRISSPPPLMRNSHQTTRRPALLIPSWFKICLGSQRIILWPRPMRRRPLPKKGYSTSMKLKKVRWSWNLQGSSLQVRKRRLQSWSWRILILSLCTSARSSWINSTRKSRDSKLSELYIKLR